MMFQDILQPHPKIVESTHSSPLQALTQNFPLCLKNSLNSLPFPRKLIRSYFAHQIHICFIVHIHVHETQHLVGFDLQWKLYIEVDNEVVESRAAVERSDDHEILSWSQRRWKDEAVLAVVLRC
ncbi:Hypothetical_protein [Hexamita inflata]|uniref:Hypothetical_protein n=1 Tax=Hexamita inflata TaxID=28002 RepID=A0AA86NZV3_9EUKA|nr:Hypothetical protein HINF_LOCUS15472 [Hexamita inflata]